MRELLESFYEAFNSHNTEVIGEHLTEDFTQTTPYGGSITKEQLLQHLKEVNTVVKEKRAEPVQWFIDDNEAAVVIEATGRQVGKWFGIEGRGQRFSITAVHLFKARDGLIEHWRPVYNADQLKQTLQK